MSRVDTSNLENIESPRDRIRRWIVDLEVFLGVAVVGWLIGESVLKVVSKGGWIAGSAVAGLAIGVFLWFWWSNWSRRAKLFCAVLLLLAIAVPFVNHHA